MWLSPHAFPALFSAVVSPFWRLEFAIENGALKSHNQLLSENEKLKLEILELKMRDASSTIAILESQNQELLEKFGRASSTPREIMVAAVLSRPSSTPYDELILDLGEAAGISSTTLVYAPGKVLIGRIVDVLPGVSRAILFTSPGQTMSVTIGPENVQATAKGRGGGQYEADVPHGSNIKVDDVVSDTSMRDRAFGVVVKVESDPSDPFDKVYFTPPINVYSVRFVEVELAPAVVVTPVRKTPAVSGERTKPVKK